jgi:protein TonB
MKMRNGRVFSTLLFAALLHAGALILVPEISPGVEQKPAEGQVPPVRISLVPPLPAPEPAPEPLPAVPAEPPPPAADSAPEVPRDIPPETAADSLASAAAEAVAEDPVVPAAVPEGAGDPAPDSPLFRDAAAVSREGPQMSGPAEPPDRRELLLQYEGMIRLLIDRNKEYPYQARRQDQEGKVAVRFVLSRRGELVGEPVLDKKSRYRLLNTSALEAVKRAIPYPPFPPEFPEEELVFSVTLAFSLSGSGL